MSKVCHYIYINWFQLDAQRTHWTHSSFALPVNNTDREKERTWLFAFCNGLRGITLWHHGERCTYNANKENLCIQKYSNNDKKIFAIQQDRMVILQLDISFFIVREKNKKAKKDQFIFLEDTFLVSPIRFWHENRIPARPLVRGTYELLFLPISGIRHCSVAYVHEIFAHLLILHCVWY